MGIGEVIPPTGRAPVRYRPIGPPSPRDWRIQFQHTMSGINENLMPVAKDCKKIINFISKSGLVSDICLLLCRLFS